MSPEVVRARRLLKKRGWSGRRAAEALNISYGHLCHVLTGRRISHELLRRISALPASPTPYRESGFAKTASI